MKNEFLFRRFEDAQFSAAKCKAALRSLELCYEDCIADRLSSEDEESRLRILLQAQTPSIPETEAARQDGLWSVCDAKNIPAGQTFDFAYRPTCLVTAILIHWVMKDPSHLLDGQYHTALTLGLRAASRRQYDGDEQGFEPGFLDVYKIYHRCGVYDFLLMYPKLSPEFSAFWLQAVRLLLNTKLEASFWTISVEDAETANTLSRETRELHADFVERMPHSPDSARLFFLSYGTDMNLEYMKRRCEDAVILGTTTIEGYRLAFRRSRSSYYASLDHREGARTPAMLWALTPKDMQALELYEGVPHCYRKREVSVRYHDTTIKATVFLLPESNPMGPPTAKYEQLIRKSYDYLGFDPSGLEEALEAAAQATPPRAKPKNSTGA